LVDQDIHHPNFDMGSKRKITIWILMYAMNS